MATRVEYNQVILHNVQTREFRQEAVWDDSNTDQLYHRFVISVVGHCHGLDNEVPTYILPDSAATSNATLNEIIIRQRLMEPRRVFKMLVGEINASDPGDLANELILLEALPIVGVKLSSNVDVNNGPKPQHVDVQQIVGTKIYRVEFQIEVCLIVCERPTNKSGVLSNRWSISEEIDGNHFAVRTVQGRLRVAAAALNANAFRHWVIPSLPRGYKRESISFLVTPDGLNIDYTCVDRQVWHAPPDPCTDWEMMHAVSTSDGVNVIEEVSVKLSCKPTANKKLLVSRAVTLIDARLHVLGKQKERDFWITHAAIADYIHANVIEARMTIQRAADSRTWEILGQDLGKTMEGAKGFQAVGRYIVRPPNFYATGSAVNSLLCYLQSPCSNSHMIPQSPSQGEPDGEVSKSTGSNPKIEVGETESLPSESPAPFSPSHSTAMYTSYAVTSEYLTNNLVVQLPRAGSSGSSGNEPSAVFVKLADQGVSKRIITVAGERIGEWPAMPAPTNYKDVTGPAHILDYRIAADAPRRTSDGQKQVRRTEATYTYGLSRPPKDKESLRVGVLPWDVLSIKDNDIPAAAFIAPNSSRAIA